jgi:hypothetical protein
MAHKMAFFKTFWDTDKQQVVNCISRIREFERFYQALFLGVLISETRYDY